MLLEGRKGVILGVANQRSIAWGIAERARAEGAELYFGAANERMQKGLLKLIAADTPHGLCDVSDDGSLDAFFAGVRERFGQIDFLLHSVAFARREDLSNPFLATPREGWAVAQDVSAYSLVATLQRAQPLFPESGGAAVSMTYLGSERAVSNYNVMGPAKAALESATRYLALELGPQNIRVNAISAGPVNTLSARGVSGLRKMLEFNAERAALKRNITTDDIAKAACFLFSDWSSGITGEVLHVDAGFSIVGI